MSPCDGTAQVAPAEPGDRVRVRVLVAYDGSGYRGFAPNRGVPTVGGSLTEALERVLGHEVSLTCAGRTDAGVHAWGQVASFDADPDRFEPDALRASLNAQCGPDVVVREVEHAPPGFDARFDAVSRTYRYSVLNRVVGDPFARHTTWHVTDPLDLDAMQAASSALVGEHDFSSFCRRKLVTEPDGEQLEASRVRRVHRAGWSDLLEGRLRFEIEAGSFCQQMVRAIVGTLVDLGRGRKRVRSSPREDMVAIVEARDRAAARTLAPPHGLCLWDVAYR